MEKRRWRFGRKTNSFRRTSAADEKWILESEFRRYGKEQAEAIWKSGDYIFQMDKRAEITGHMTKIPVQEEFIERYDLGALDERFQVIRE